jgi:hypothetical protein
VIDILVLSIYIPLLSGSLTSVYRSFIIFLAALNVDSEVKHRLIGPSKGYQTIVKGYGDQQQHDDLFHQQQHEDLFSSSKAKQKVCIFISFGSSMKIYDRWAIESHQKLRHHII